ncbi:MAG: enoyl-CoA hydratase/isomerase family protein [Deltaproteobacteria bacterium]|nr:enoyl-CoA hydratase/isomerase family protein [Deltaproteobacteria bacterium]
MAEYQYLKVRDADGAAWISINRPPLNVLDIPTMEELNDALSKVKARESALCTLVLTAEGDKAFSAGVEVADHTPDKVDRMIEVFHQIFRHLDTLEIPTIASVKGAALGGGCEVALFCDMIVAAENLKIGQPEIKLGVFPPLAVVMLPRMVPEKRAFELLCGGEVIRAPEAVSLGLVNKVIPLASFAEEFGKFLATFTSLSGASLRATKRAIRAAKGLSFGDALARVERLYLHDLMPTEDAREGLTAFLEKRPAVWQNC